MKNMLIFLFLICFAGRLFAQAPPPQFVNDSSSIRTTYSYSSNGQLIGSATHYYVRNIGGSGVINVTVTVSATANTYTENKQFTVQGNTRYEFISAIPLGRVSGLQTYSFVALFPGYPELRLAFTPVVSPLRTESTVPTGPPNSSLVFRMGFENGWTYINTFTKASVPVPALALSGTNLFAGTGGDGVFLSTNGGVSWTAVNNGLTNHKISCIAVNGTNLLAGTSGGVFRSTNSGTSWTAVNTGLTSTEVHSLAVNGTNLFAGTWNGGIFLSTNNGTSWSAVNAGLIYESKGVWCLASSGTNLFAGICLDGAFRSTDNGASWTRVSNGLPDSTSVVSFAISGNNIFAATLGGGVFLSTNNGTNWTGVNSGLTNKCVNCVAVYGAKIFAGTDDGVFLSTNNGTSWTDESSGLAYNDVSSIAVSDSNLFIATYSGGVFRKPLSEMIPLGVEDTKNHIPTEFSLAQNYPNPFNPSTTISFGLPSQSFVSLKVFDLLGKEVATIVSEELSAGSHVRQWNANGMPSGVYFYRLQAGSVTEAKKLVLLR
jgi:photosystem II stability/assembly factor-like uncharacterized protein